MEQRKRTLENMVIDRQFWRGRRVLITGHTGFKGSWLSLLLRSLGAEVTGLSLPPATPNDLFVVARVEPDVTHVVGDVRDFDTVLKAISRSEPEIVFHLAAQSLVRASYSDPIGTYATNVMGTAHVLEAARRCQGIDHVLIVTSDKCYDNIGVNAGYREVDRLGGHDPYSNSKACAELVSDSYRRSFLGPEGRTTVSSARAGNVIGGGDWAADRLIPDAISAFKVGHPLRIRNPAAIRPWQHVLDPLIGYLMVCQPNASCNAGEAWNFGPSAASEVPVARIADGLARRWGEDAHWEHDTNEQPHEAKILKLDCSKAIAKLGWTPQIDLEWALDMVVEWYRAWSRGLDTMTLTRRQIHDFMDLCERSVVSGQIETTTNNNFT